jgi:hypothetical protein
LIDIKQNASEALAMRMILQVVSNHQLLMLQLVGGAITSLKNIKVNGKDDNPYMKWKIKVMFQPPTSSIIEFIIIYPQIPPSNCW